MAATAAVLAQQANKGIPGSNHASPPNSHSPACRNMSISPNDELASADAIRQNEYSYMNNNGGTDMYLQSPPLVLAMFGTAMRPTLYTTSYPPPTTLEPSVESHQSGSGRAGGSPPMGIVGWASPSHMSSHMPSPIHSDSGSAAYVYPDPEESPTPYNLVALQASAGPTAPTRERTPLAQARFDRRCRNRSVNPTPASPVVGPSFLKRHEDWHAVL